MSLDRLRIGTAGWTIPRAVRDRFPEAGSGLERYAARFTAAEINSTFYGVHKRQTFQRWAASVPDDFRFAVKIPKAITHTNRLAESERPTAELLDQIAVLGAKLGPLLVQLPPSLAFDEPVARRFFENLRTTTAGPVACEPRHPSWFEEPADELLQEVRVARVAADPARVPESASPGGWPGLVYYRLHGSPRMYYSEYGAAYLAELAGKLGTTGAIETWCIFDNTTSGAAAADALCLQSNMITAARPG